MIGSHALGASCGAPAWASPSAAPTAVPSLYGRPPPVRRPTITSPQMMEDGPIRAGQQLHVEDVRCATLLSELVYKAADAPDEAAFKRAQVTVEEAVGASLSGVRCHKSGGQRFLVGETEDAIYVAFQGTKSAIDWLANLNFFHGHFGLQHHHHHSSSSSSSVSSHSSFSSTSSSFSSGSSDSSSTSRSSSRSRSSRAHIGFLKRANGAAVSISELHATAAAAGKRLVLTGHSLGGAVAVLTTVRLLRSLAAAQGQGLSGLTAEEQLPRVRCISFATPAMANSDLLQEVTAAGWDQFITNIVMPEDPVVPFVNLLLKAPASPSQPQGTGPSRSPSSFFAGLDSPSSSASSSSSSVAPDLSRLNSQESHLSLNSASWGSNLTFEPSALADDLSVSLAAAGASAVATLQPLQDQLQQAAADSSWLGGDLAAADAAAELAAAREALGRSLSFAVAAADASPAGAAVPTLEQSTGSQELASWLAAARDAINRQAGSQPSQRSFQDSSRCNSNSGNSLSSMTTEAFAAWPAASSSSDDYSSSAEDSPSALSPASLSHVGHSFGVPVVASWALDTSSLVLGSEGSTAGGSSPRELPSPSSHQWQDGQSPDAATPSLAAQPAAAAAASTEDAAAARSGSSQRKQHLAVNIARQLRRLQQQLASSRVGRLAWISGALAAGARCASALAAPAAVAGGHVPLLALLPRALAGPAALAVLHFVGHAAYQAALPPSHPLGQQWVMTDAGLELVAKPLNSYPRTGEGLGLKELGGLFPGHRMIAYRRRLANLVSQSPAAAAAGAQDAAAEPAEQ